MTAQPIETFSASLALDGDAWGDVEQLNTLTVIRDVAGGVSGPVGDDLTADSFEAADDVLFAAGYLRATEWEQRGAYKVAALTRMV